MKHKDDEVLHNFIDEFFDIDTMIKIGFFKEKMRNDYPAMADRICTFFGYKTVFEYGHVDEPFNIHMSWVSKHRPKDEPFVRTIRSIYED